MPVCGELAWPGSGDCRPHARIETVWIDVVRDGEPAIVVHARFRATGPGLIIWTFGRDGRPLRDRDGILGDSRGRVAGMRSFTTGDGEAHFEDFAARMPAAQLHAPLDGLVLEVRTTIWSRPPAGRRGRALARHGPVRARL